MNDLRKRARLVLAMAALSRLEEPFNAYVRKDLFDLDTSALDTRLVQAIHLEFANKKWQLAFLDRLIELTLVSRVENQESSNREIGYTSDHPAAKVLQKLRADHQSSSSTDLSRLLWPNDSNIPHSPDSQIDLIESALNERKKLESSEVLEPLEDAPKALSEAASEEREDGAAQLLQKIVACSSAVLELMPVFATKLEDVSSRLVAMESRLKSLEVEAKNTTDSISETVAVSLPQMEAALHQLGEEVRTSVDNDQRERNPHA